MGVQEKALVKVTEAEQPQRALTLHETLNLGEVLYKSGYFKDINSAAQAVVKILRGQELGIGPVASLENIYVVDGKTALGAGLIASFIKQSGRYDYRILELTDKGCKLAFFENGKKIGESSFTEQDAQRAGLLGKNSWQKYPRNMYFARALSNGARWYCPDVFRGPIYTPEELSDKDVIEAEALVIEEEPKGMTQQTEYSEPPKQSEAQEKPTQAKTNGKKRDDKWWAKYFQSYVNAGIAKDIEDAHRVAREAAGLEEGESLNDLSDRELNQLLVLAIQNAKAKGQKP